MAITLILGGARSGKSRRAQSLAEASAPARLYVATAEAHDAEMAERIAHHQADRGDGWQTLEAPLDLVGALNGLAPGDTPVLVDCLTLWLSNLMHHGGDVEAETVRLCSALKALQRPVFLVSNEVGLGLVPETPLGRAFRDAQGRLNQAVAEVSDVVEFVAAGLPLRLKG
ncbi:bifunctional adenosylcobinamide kinase/adenosylcobinamide-phosphate guanylyltransferase [Henriciella aquimarina]|uniref:bifunctional adenosylcobinamide kinase/adenosylcobinamide-phosphate guanylyltransferase n=1 Tax=Henriciella aquimarina TaxID=545261 RepID=UPI0009FD420D|nr:bifunctional adenosylcobinamide kinase/adenosylcobinamide-phosphate guanylyltransferase [Henriciella aquimarina]